MNIKMLLFLLVVMIPSSSAQEDIIEGQIALNGYVDNSGDILTLPQPGAFQKDFSPAVAGHISLSTSNYEAELLSAGTLTMEGKEYKVLMTSPMNPGKGMSRWV